MFESSIIYKVWKSKPIDVLILLLQPLVNNFKSNNISYSNNKGYKWTTTDSEFVTS